MIAKSENLEPYKKTTSSEQNCSHHVLFKFIIRENLIVRAYSRLYLMKRTKIMKLRKVFPQYLLFPLLFFGFTSVDSSRGGILGWNGRDLMQWHAHPSLLCGLPLYGRKSPVVESFWAMDFKLRERKEDKT